MHTFGIYHQYNIAAQCSALLTIDLYHCMYVQVVPPLFWGDGRPGTTCKAI